MIGSEAVLPDEMLPDEMLPDEMLPDEMPDAGASLADELFEAVAALGAFEDADDVPGQVAGDVVNPASRATPPPLFHLSRPDRTFVTVRPDRSVLVGRNPPAVSGQDVLDVAHPLASRRHLVVRSGDGRLFADELGSRNGTIVRRGGAALAVDGTLELYAGDQIVTAGGVVLFDVGAGTRP